MANRLTDVQAKTLRDIRDGEVTTNDHYHMLGCRGDVYSRLEEAGLAVVDWNSPLPGFRAKFERYPVAITGDGLLALRDYERDR